MGSGGVAQPREKFQKGGLKEMERRATGGKGAFVEALKPLQREGRISAGE
jgi:hypothetical protein